MAESELAQSLVLIAQSILKNGIISPSAMSQRQSNSELINSITNLLEIALALPSPAKSEKPAANSTSQQSKEEEIDDVYFDSTSKALYIPNPEFIDTSDIDQSGPREAQDVTVKFWYLSADKSNTPQQDAATLQADDVKQALRLLKDTTGLETVDTFILQVPKIHFDDEELPEDEEVTLIDSIRSLYTDISQIPEISSLGLSEFSLCRLKRFLLSSPSSEPRTNGISSIPSSKQPMRKPRVNQINLRNCCSVQSSLLEFANEQQVELLTHSDCADLLTTSTFRSILQSFGSRLPQQLQGALKDNDSLRARWVMKYTVLHKARSLVIDKGYIVYAAQP